MVCAARGSWGVLGREASRRCRPGKSLMAIVCECLFEELQEHTAQSVVGKMQDGCEVFRSCSK